MRDRKAQMKDISIRPAEAILWSWTSIWRSIVAFLLLSIFGMLGILGLLLGILLCSYLLAQGFSSNMQDEHTYARPNQGIWLSARHSIFLGLLSACLSIPLTVPFIILAFSSPPPDPLLGSPSSARVALAFATFVAPAVISFVGLVTGLLHGGNACIKHIILRFLLWRAGAIHAFWTMLPSASCYARWEVATSSPIAYCWSTSPRLIRQQPTMEQECKSNRQRLSESKYREAMP